MFVTYAGIRTGSEDIRKLIEERDGETLLSRLAPAEDLSGEKGLTLVLDDALSEEQAGWLAELILPLLKGSVYIKSRRLELLRPFLTCGREFRTFLDFDRSEENLQALLPFLKNENTFLVVDLWEQGKRPLSAPEGLARLDEITSLVLKYDLLPEKIYLKPGDKAVNCDPESTRFYLETLRRLKEDCYPEYGTVCPVRWGGSDGIRDEESVIFLTLLACLGQDGILIEDFVYNENGPVESISRWIDSINTFV